MWIDYEEIRRMADNIRAMCGDDQDTFLDTLDGETDAMDILGTLIKERNEVLGNEAALKELAKQYKERADRMNAKADAIAQTMGHLLDAMGERKVQHPFATVSRTKPRARVVIEDEHQIPTQLMKVKKSPDLTAIKAQMDAGVYVPGAATVLGNEGVTVRSK
jgi:hypothetical protein